MHGDVGLSGMTFASASGLFFFVFLKFTMLVLKRLKEGPPSPRPPHNLPRKELAESPRPPPLRIPRPLHQRIFQPPRWKILTLLFGPRNWTLCSKKKRMRNLRILKSFIFRSKHSQSAHFPIPGTGIDNLSTYRRISDVQSSLDPRGPEIFGLLCNHALSEGQCVTKDSTEGTLAKIGQFLRSFQGMYFLLSI
jgi:hypothetical protein